MENNYKNKGVAWANQYKKNERHPDFKGKGNFKGVEFEFAAWKKNGEDEQLNFTFSEPYKKQEQQEEEIIKPQKNTTIDDGIPF